MKNFLILIMVCATFSLQAQVECEALLLSNEQVFFSQAETVHNTVERMLKKASSNAQRTPETTEAYRKVALGWRKVKVSLGAPEHLQDWAPSALKDSNHISAYYMISKQEMEDLKILLDEISDYSIVLGSTINFRKNINRLRSTIEKNNISGVLISPDQLEKLNVQLRVKYLQNSEFASFSAAKNSDITNSLAEKLEANLGKEYNFWSDTVLEGDFNLTGEMKHSGLKTVHLNEEIVGYEMRITASAKKNSSNQDGSLVVIRYLDKQGEIIQNKSLPEFIEN